MALTQEPAQAVAPPQAAPVSEFVAFLSETSLEDLRQRWRSAHPGVAIPKGLSRDLMIRGIVWNEQCSRYGGLPAEAERVLDKMARQLATSGTLEIERSVRPKAGTRIIRAVLRSSRCIWRDSRSSRRANAASIRSAPSGDR